MWAGRTEAILAPLPDYRTLVGDDTGTMFDYFDILLMSSPRPNDVTATLVVARARAAETETDSDTDTDTKSKPKPAATKVAAFVDRDRAITWAPSPLGSRGTRPVAALPHPKDDRVFLVPSPDRIILTPPEYLEHEPAWLDTLAAVEAESADSPDVTGPVALVTVTGFPQKLRLPLVGKIPAPLRATASLTNAGRGFYVRGILTFATPDHAEAFAAAIARAKQSALSGFAARLLEGFGAFNAADQLVLEQRDNTVMFATSLSIIDARALLDHAAEWTQKFYESKLRSADDPDEPVEPIDPASTP
jgi:hypothetical protein